MEAHTIRENLQQFQKPVLMAGGDYFDHIRTLKRIALYHGGKFESGDKDSSGGKKYFYNITKPACDIATKFIDLDTKDIVLYSERAGDEYKVWVMQRDLKMWLKEERFGVLLNEIAYDFPKYGHVVLKKSSDNKWHKVNIENLRMDPSAETLANSMFVYEVLVMSKREIREMKEWGQEAKDELFQRTDDAHFTVYQCYDYNCDEGKRWKRSFRAGFLSRRGKDGSSILTPESDLANNQGYEEGVVLYEDEMDELPYRELKWESIPGRWLGFGFGEYLFDNQIRQNEVANIKARGLALSSLQLFQSSDDTIAKNVFTEMENGDIIYTQGGIQPVQTAERNLGAFQLEEQRWDLNADRKTFSFDIARGEPLPSQTPLGVAQLQAGMVASYFDIKRENFGLFVKQLMLDDIIPSFEREKRKNHVLKFFGSDKEIGKLRRAFTDHTMRKAVLDYALKTGVIPTAFAIDAERAKIELSVRKKKDLYLEVPDDFYSDVKYVIDVVVTNEQVDVAQRIQTLQAALSMVGSNPMIVQDRGLRTIFLKLLEFAGVSAVELDLLDEQLEEDVGPLQQMLRELKGAEAGNGMGAQMAQGAQMPQQEPAV